MEHKLYEVSKTGVAKVEYTIGTEPPYAGWVALDEIQGNRGPMAMQTVREMATGSWEDMNTVLLALRGRSVTEVAMKLVTKKIGFSEFKRIVRENS